MSAATERFHAGEQALQLRAGVRTRMAEIGAAVIRDAMPEQHQRFFEQLPFVIVGGRDRRGQPWASAMAGPPGFVTATTARRLLLSGARDPADPVLGAGLHVGAALGLLGIEPHTRRRNRANGIVGALPPSELALEVRESFGNCPKYIHARRASFDPSRVVPPQSHRSIGVEPAFAAVIAAADTCFIATAHPEVGVDVSHRGGRPGFVHVDGDTLWMPDYSGNFFFNTLGNLVIEPRAGLLFIDLARGDLWHAAGEVAITWDGPEVAAFAGAQRLLRITIREVLCRVGALPLRWGPGEPSPHLPAPVQGARSSTASSKR